MLYKILIYSKKRKIIIHENMEWVFTVNITFHRHMHKSSILTYHKSHQADSNQIIFISNLLLNKDLAVFKSHSLMLILIWNTTKDQQIAFWHDQPFLPSTSIYTYVNDLDILHVLFVSELKWYITVSYVYSYLSISLLYRVGTHKWFSNVLSTRSSNLPLGSNWHNIIAFLQSWLR